MLVDAVLNFPNHVHSYPVPASSSPADIRAAAATASTLMRSEAGENPAAEQEESGDRTSNVVGTMSGVSGNEFMDEEALFDMPNLLVDMAGGMLVSPPRMNSPPSDDSPGNSDGESLWTYD
ncbi:ethylene-responsive transcription factor ERF027-like [Camellia sinensis]|uniref:ethylene-responsive transcription factor ERF027-like n=1 Tax=Camellia sinensis TaxID=4442 RepID=UPI0010356BA0|nr:ethylene-responsive transcription factor ERF027-like [Camellia sinensis]